MKTFQFQQRQRGAALIVSVILLLAATMATLASVRGNAFHERMAANQAYKGMSFMSAETGATRFLAWLEKTSTEKGWPTDEARRNGWQDMALDTCPGDYGSLKDIQSCVVIDPDEGVRWDGNTVHARVVGRVVSPAGVLSESVIDLELEGQSISLNRPNPQAAYTCYGEFCSFSFRGSPVKISGYDHPVSGGDFECNGGGCNFSPDTWNDAAPGISMPNRPSGGAADKPKQVEGDPPVQRGGGGGASDQSSAWQSYANALLNAGLAKDVGGKGDLAPSNRDNPGVSNIVGNVTLNGNADTAGVIIVGPGAALSVKGTFHHEGLIIILPGGTFDVSAGTAWIYGGIVDMSGNMQGHLVDLRGNVHVRYSSEALGNLNKLNPPGRLAIKGWAENMGQPSGENNG